MFRSKMWSDDFSPRRVFVITIASIFLAEILAMILISNFNGLPYWLTTLVDAGIMIVIIFPVVYNLLFRSLLLQIEERKRANALMEKLFYSIDILIAYMDRDFNFVRVNDSYARSGGHPVDYFLGKNHFDLYPNEENLGIFRQVVQSGEPYSVFEKAFEYAEYPERGVTYWDWSLQPLKAGDGSVEGVILSLMDVTPRKAAELQLERQNQELRDLSEAEHRQRELAEGLVQSMIVLNRSLELEQVLRSILEQIRKAIPFQGADILLLEENRLMVAGYVGFEDHVESIPAMGRSYSVNDYPLLERVCQTLQPVNIDCVSNNPEWRSWKGMDWVGSHLSVPLCIGSQVIGVIGLNNERVGAFSQGMVEQLMAFAAPAALALHNAQLYKAEMIARRGAEIISATSQALTYTMDLDQRLNTILDHLNAIVAFDMGGVALMGVENFLETRVLRGLEQLNGSDSPTEMSFDIINFPALQKMVSTQKALLIPNSANYLSKDLPSWFKEMGSWLVAPIVAGEKFIGMVGLGKLEIDYFRQEDLQWVEALVGQAAVTIQNAWLFDQVRSSSERLQALARKLVEIQENERYHIARELHDEAGQALSSLKLGLGILEQDSECPPRLSSRLAELKNVADSVLEELRRLAMDLRPVALDHLGLVAALEQYVQNLNSSTLLVKFKARGFADIRLAPDVETSLYRIVQEAVTNVVRHAKARNIGILLERLEGQVKVFVEDDGVGFAPDLLDHRDHMGLLGIRERAEMFGGNLTIESFPGGGTSIIVEVPDVYSNPDRG